MKTNLSTLAKRVRRIAAGEKGATMIEYCFMVSLIAVAAFAAVTTVGTIVSSLYTTVP